MSRAFWLDRGWYILWNLLLVFGALAAARYLLVQPIIDAVEGKKDMILRKRIVILTDAQIKALPTTPITIVPVPGAGFRIKPLAATFVLTTTAGAYTNINTTFAALQLQNDSSTWLSLAIVNDSTTTPATTLLTNLLGAAVSKVIDIQIPGLDSVPIAASIGYVKNYEASLIPTVAGLDNIKLSIAIDNNGSGVLTGGNAANTLKVTIYYAIESV